MKESLYDIPPGCICMGDGLFGMKCNAPKHARLKAGGPMNSEQDALKACPFCGSNGKLDLSDFGSAMVYCSAESISVDCPVNPETGFHDTQEQAIAAWNTRTEQDANGGWMPITPENLPKKGDEVGCFADDRCCVYEVCDFHLLFTYEVWVKQRAMTHFRPINPPAPPHGAQEP